MGNKDKYAGDEQYSNGIIFERVNIWNGKKNYTGEKLKIFDRGNIFQEKVL